MNTMEPSYVLFSIDTSLLTGGNVFHEIEDKVGGNDWLRVLQGTRIQLRILYLLLWR